MSGHKSAVVTISQEEYRRLYEAERNLYYENMEQSSLIRDHELENQVRELACHLQDRESHFLNLIQDIDQGLRGIEQDSAQGMLNEQLNYLNEIILNQSDRLTSTLEENDSREHVYQERIDQIQSQIDSQFTEFQNFIKMNYDEDNTIHKLAMDNLKAIHLLTEIIAQSYPEHIFNFNNFNKKNAEIALIESNLAHHANQSALSISQSLYISLSNHKRDCDKRYLEWQILQNQVTTDLQLLKDNFSINRKIQPIDKNGQLIGDEIDSDFWTQGAYRDLEQHVIDMITYLNDKNQDISCSELKAIVKDFIHPIQDLIIQCLMDARINALNAQIRYEIANTVLVALVEQGFKPVTGDYQDGSYFGSYKASALNSSGNQVDIFVEPGPSNNLENSLHVISQNSRFVTMNELQSRAQEIRNSLIEHGLEVGVFSEIGPPSETQMTTLNRTQNKVTKG